MLKRALFRLLRLSLLPLLIRETFQRNRVTIILYHDPSPEAIENNLGVLKRTYNIISLEEFVHAYRTGQLDELPTKSLIITFDDGHRNNYKLKRVFEASGVPITIFVCAGIIETQRRFWFQHVPPSMNLTHLPDAERRERLRELGFDEVVEGSEREALSRSEIEEMSPLVDFQSHTVSHAILPYCIDEKARAEIFDSKTMLEEEYGLRIYAISYPNGDYSDRDARIAEEAGYECGVTVDLGLNSAATDPFRLKRICITDDASAAEVLVKASGLWGLVRNLTLGQAYGHTKPSVCESR